MKGICRIKDDRNEADAVKFTESCAERRNGAIPWFGPGTEERQIKSEGED
jgi:hypothetical protein